MEKQFFGQDTVVLENVNAVPEKWMVYSSKGNTYRWWEFPHNKGGYKAAIKTAIAIRDGLAVEKPIEEKVKGGVR